MAQAEGYWHGLRNGGSIPSRSDVDPRGISGILEYAFILEQIAPGIAKIRLCGQSLNEALGMEMRGIPISSLFLPEARYQFQKALQKMFEGPSTIQASLISKGGFTQKDLEAQLFIAPLRDEQGRVTRALGTFQINDKVNRAPRRFDFRDLVITRIESNAAALEASRLKQATSDLCRDVQGLAEQRTDFSFEADATPRSKPIKSRSDVSHLRLVQTD
ncbi:PAS domain-containing protein [Aliiroseovarius sp. KMU-50]|uniref:PAS domain-containing protein n=1 Tax=Aliiroseovarius salicola TaxID=3009082 RepID=A0ABT4W587_9RHOB|nr:PAS domain-containing protein [Aliiroseovarius sp. KMU-50]MDA5094908.1 PAS domain-containing protein [Aliiroseovarius sp. KMU-50]